MKVTKKKSKRKIRRKKIKFKSIAFKLSENQYRSMSNYCKARKITINKLIKKSLARYTEGFETEIPKHIYPAGNQLDLFNELSVAEQATKSL